MENNEPNRIKVAQAVWETLSLDDLHEQFIFHSVQRYRSNPDSFNDDVEMMGLTDEGDE